MKSSQFDLQGNGISIGVRHWLPDGEVAGVIQICHGMAEHSGRYERLAEALTGAGWAVIAGDHRGHGRTAESSGMLGHFADHQGWNLVVEDIRAVALHAMSQHPDKPMVMLGHSMGSLLARDYATRYGADLTGLVISGIPNDGGLIGKAGGVLAKGLVKARGPRSDSKLMDKLTFGSFNSRFKPNRTEFDWLSRDEASVDEYVADPLCGFTCTNQFFVDLVGGAQRVNTAKVVASTPKDLPMLLLVGQVDPAGGTRTLEAVTELYKKVGLKKLTGHAYEDARHEVYNETNRDEVIGDTLSWLDEQILAEHK